MPRPNPLFRSLRSHLRVVAASAGVVTLCVFAALSMHHASYATAADSGTLASNVARSAPDFAWKQNPSSSLRSVGRNSINLESCPTGVIATEPAYFVYIAGAGVPEAVRVTGGSCKGDGHAGTLEFTTAKPHPTGYSVGSASGGIQEASIAARFVAGSLKQPPQSGRVTVSPGEYDIFAPVSIRASNQVVDFSGSIINCYTPDDPCILVGDAASSNKFFDITLNGPRGRPMVVSSTKPFIEVNAQQTRIVNVSTRWPPPNGSFGSLVQVDDDQAFLLDGMDTASGGSAVTCNPSYCGAFVSAPGPFNRWSAVGWLKNLNISLQCAGKGVDWASGNSLRISDSVIQGWSVFGVRVTNQRGGYSGLITDNVYFEASPSCKQYSPYGNVGSAGIIVEGPQVKVMGTNANGPSGVLPNWGRETGSHTWLYWVVPVSDKFGEGVPLPAGHALTNGSGSITGTFPKIAGASSYKILKRDWDGGTLPRPYPQGTGNYLLAIVQQSSCSSLTCSFTDNGEALSSYTNAGESTTAKMYMPRLDFWPGGIVLSSAEDVSGERYAIPSLMLHADVLAAGAVVTTQPAWAVAGEANALIASPASPSAAANIEAMHTNGIGPFPGATILLAANLPQQSPSGYKGRLNFGHGGQPGGFTPVITLADSNWGKTWSTSSHRPRADVNDLDIGYEGNIDTLYTRAQNEVRAYVGKLPDGNPQEKLSASTKTFNVPVTINGNLTVTGKCSGCGGSGGGTVEGNAGRGTVSLTGQKAAIPVGAVCAASACGAGQYRVTYYIDATQACSSAGNASAGLTIGWKDESNARTLRVPLAGAGVANGNSLSLGQTSSFGSGTISVWSDGGPITYSTAYTPCATGTGSYALRIAVEKIQ